MRPSNKQRSRNKPGGNGGQHQQRRPSMGNIINRVFESAGPDGKVRGTPQQIIDKYQLLARDAQLAGDRVAAENYLQHAEHYSRLLGDAQRQQQEARFNQEREESQRAEEGQREENRPQRFDEGFEPQRRQPAMAQSDASGLAMIEPDDSFDLAGPIETPEGRRSAPLEPVPAAPHSRSEPRPESRSESRPAPRPQPRPEPELRPEPHANGTSAAEAPAVAVGEERVELAEPQAQPAKRPRQRRRSKPAEAPVEAAPQAD
ncbi:DUF4167 domain-containing protein [Amaricoccus sp.]|uniref:DUF4167 domain-containing protein n=1 Tax=Amaricoccus sp. TaxID=1872485 RepID=UPI002615D29D|nr:DUF4167 domain-containing protein [Amaricoccus sp.]HRO12040.1 DUF4167 domain-containing protein [Amaricoccus sp.]